MRNKSTVIKHCNNWYKSPAGQDSLTQAQALCREMLSEIFGYYAIEIGMLSGGCDLLKDSRIAASFSLASPDSDHMAAIQPIASTDAYNRRYDDKPQGHFATIAANEQLPISTDNVDLVLASHIFEMSPNPHQVLREIDRVLVPEGHCILLGFNPYALSNLNKPLSFSRQPKQKNYKMRSVHRVRDWFSLLGFEVLDVNYLGFRPAVKNPKLFNSLKWLDHLGQYAGPLLGSLYIVHAKKQVVAMRPHKKVWQAPALLKGGKVALNQTAQKARRNNYSN